MRHETDSWYDTLPAVLLGIRAAWKADIGASPAELLYGEPLRLPGEFFAPTQPDNEDESFVAKLRRHFRRIQLVPASHHGERPVFVHQDLQSASQVFVRTDATRPPLQPPYVGPFRVVRRDAKFFVVGMKGKEKAVSVDRLKPSYILAAEDGRHDAGGTSGPPPAIDIADRSRTGATSNPLREKGPFPQALGGVRHLGDIFFCNTTGGGHCTVASIPPPQPY
ncbi:uncharacterized protein LOC124163001 [Ischnura elegans]|uniref:uncharacterized protein LOC124163001 n=1 Tax=Ischnura elegans TaxID=197161 RepID=UPI001ED8726B|nr:uncharacterized protein LOC124163001 [Ischnura elegans]